MNITILDTETTGLLAPCGCDPEHQPHIVEIAAIQVDENFKIIGKYYTKVNPPIPIPPQTTKVHGLADEDVRNAPTFKKVLKGLNKFLKKSDLLVCHNVTYDKTVIEVEAQRIGKKAKIPIAVFCTVEQSFHMFGFRPSLLKLYTHLTGETEINKQHSAVADTKALLKIYRELINGMAKY